MTTSRRSTELLSLGRRSNAKWLQATPGERFTIRTSVEEPDGNFTVLEVVADPGNGVPMHIHANEDEHFIVLDGTLHIANGDTTLDSAAGRSAQAGCRISRC